MGTIQVRGVRTHVYAGAHGMTDLPDLKLADPVMDAAQGRPMIVLEPVTETVAEASERISYDLTSNYGNKKFGVTPDEPAVVCRYVSDVSNDPNKPYTFPRSRLRLIDAHHADGGERLYDRVQRDVLERLFDAAFRSGQDRTLAILEGLAQDAVGKDAMTEARELAAVERQFGGDG